MESRAQERERELEDLDRRIMSLASQIYAATCEWLGLVAEWDRISGWAEFGCRSCAQYLSWRCGISLTAAREHVRVARRLEELPAIRAAFARGELSYSKVRALSRMQQPAREAELAALARHATASQLDELVRGYRSVVAVEMAAADPSAAPSRYLHIDAADDGSVLIRAKLPAEEGAMVKAVLMAEADRLWRAEQDAAPAQQDAARGARGRGEAEGTAAPDGTLARESTPAGGCDESPPRRTLAERAADALVDMIETAASAGSSGAGRTGGDRYQVVVHVDSEILLTPAAEVGQRCEIEDAGRIAAETARRLCCDAGIVPLVEREGRTVDVGRRTRAIPPATRRALRARDGGCQFPGCTERRHVDGHHIEHWALGGKTKLSNLVELCRHHHRLVHEGGYTVNRLDDGAFEFRRPTGRRIPRVPRLRGGEAQHVRERHRTAHDACATIDYAPMDRDLGVLALLEHAPIRLEAATAPGI